MSASAGEKLLTVMPWLPSQLLPFTTIAAPAEPSHVLRQFREDLDAIRAHGESAVSLAGRQFTIKRQFLEDVAGQDQASRIARLGKALLVFHSPQDATVAIEQAQKIYEAARHPKSFISLDGADHLQTEEMRAILSRYLDLVMGL